MDINPTTMEKMVDTTIDTIPIYNTQTMNEPTAAFHDKTKEVQEWTRDIDSYFLPKLASTCNKCPWGCSEFFHEVG